MAGRSLSPDEALAAAEASLRAAEYATSRELCAALLRADAQNARAHYLLGVIAFENDEPAESVVHLERAIAATPGKIEYHDYLQAVLAASGRVAEAGQAKARGDKQRAFNARFGSLPEGIQNYQRSVDWMRASRYLDFPHEVSIETLAVCNAACVFCPYPDLERKGDKMPDALVEKIIADLRDVPQDLPFSISPFKINDPLLDVRIFDIMGEINARLPNAALRMFTNGSPLTEKHVARLARVRNLAQLWVSLNHHEEQRYEQIMKLPLKRTLERLDMLHRKKAAGEFPPPVQVSRVCDGSPEDQAFLDFVTLRYPLFQAGMVAQSEWLGQVPGLLAAGKLHPVGCGRWFELSITATGQVAFCCMDGRAEYPIGDVSKSHVLEVYNNPDYRRYREHFADRTEGAPCRSCTNF
ncbi:MAG: SPASM domain-containing protein [Pseudomonadota bacterium]